MYNMILSNKFSQYWVFPFPKSSIKIVFSCQRHQGLRTTALLLWTYYMVCVWLRIFLTDNPGPLWQADSAALLQHIPALLRIEVPFPWQLWGRLGAGTASPLLYTCRGRDTATLLLSLFYCRCFPEHSLILQLKPSESYICSRPSQGPLRASQWCSSPCPPRTSHPHYPHASFLPCSPCHCLILSSPPQAHQRYSFLEILT